MDEDLDIKDEVDVSEYLEQSMDCFDSFNKMEDSISINDDMTGFGEFDNELMKSEYEEMLEDQENLKDLQSERFDSEDDEDKDYDAVSDFMNRSNKVNAEIYIDFKVPPQHLIETRICRCPTQKQLQEFKQLKVKMRLGPFNKSEDRQIKKNFKKFCKMHNIEKPKEFMDKYDDDANALEQTFKFKDLKLKDRIEFMRIIARGLNNRYLFSVYGRFQHLMNKVTARGRYTQAEDMLLLNSVNNNRYSKTKFIEAAELLGRTRYSIAQRYYLLTANEYKNDNNLVWTKVLTENFLKHLLKHCGVRTVNELRNIRIGHEVYESISQIMQISPSRLRTFWLGRLSSQLFCEEYVTLQWIRIKLIKLFYKAKIKSRRDIQWNEVALLFNGLSPLFLWQKFDKLVKHRVPAEHRENFEDCLNYLHDEVIPQLKRGKYDRELRRCTFTVEEGLKFIEEEISE